MNKLNILTFPDPRLRKKASPITVFDENLKNFAEDMLFTMYESNGIGLAATQVDFHKRLIVIDVSDEQNDPYFLVNPTFKVLDDTIEHFKEGCLSVPSFFEDIYRPKKIELTFQDLEGKQHVEIAEG
ncbi:MAG: peptide deformylase, partial [Pseudomonadota bacterium]|nr:peptide deformylase [Pseudomonadota bacterium]